MTVRKAIQVYPVLKQLSQVKRQKRKQMLANCPCKVYSAIGDIAQNVLKGKIKVSEKHRTKLKRYKNHLRKIAGKKNKKHIKKILNQKGGLAFLPLLLKPALSLLAGTVLNKLVNK